MNILKIKRKLTNGLSFEMILEFYDPLIPYE